MCYMVELQFYIGITNYKTVREMKKQKIISRDWKKTILIKNNYCN